MMQRCQHLFWQAPFLSAERTDAEAGRFVLGAHRCRRSMRLCAAQEDDWELSAEQAPLGAFSQR